MEGRRGPSGRSTWSRGRGVRGVGLVVCGFWIPACAGMTGGWFVFMGLSCEWGFLDSGLRRNDGMVAVRFHGVEL